MTATTTTPSNATPPAAAFTAPALKFNTTPIHPNDIGNILLRFRERGFAKISGVFEPESVDAYIEQVRAAVQPGPAWWWPYDLPKDSPLTIWPAKAPRLREVLRGGFMPFIDRPMPVLMAPGWLIKPSNPDEKLVHDWHKDGDHTGTTSNLGYNYPTVIHVNMYFADTTVEHGPTFVIPRSHRDPTLSPWGGAKEEPMLCDKGDVVIWDQRLWHRASPRTIDGLRIVAIFAFYGVPIYERPIRPTPAHKQAYLDATDPAEKILFGGPVDLS